MQFGRVAAVGQICNRRRVKCAAKVMLCVCLLAAYVSVLLRESLQALEETTKRRESDAARTPTDSIVGNHQNQFDFVPNKAAIRSLATNRFISQRRRARNETLAAAIAEATRRAHLRNTKHQRNRQRNRHNAAHDARIPDGAKPNRPHSDATNASTNSESLLRAAVAAASATVNPIYEYSAEQNAATQADLQQRHAVLSDACERHDWLARRPPNAWEFFISPGHGLAWCNVFKAASSTWLYYFNILAGIDPALLQKTKRPPLEMARQHFPRPSPAELDEALQSSISFLIVREPFERLLSAYRDKLEGLRNKYYKKLGAQIVRRFRKGRTKKLPGAGPTFREFVQYVIDSQRRGEPIDEHWRAVYEFCTPCSINFTLIAKVETFRRDTEYIIRQAGLETLLFNKMPQKREKEISNRADDDTRSIVAKYFAQLDTDLLQSLLVIYEPDFELFGYNSTKYHDLVQHIERPVTGGSSTTVPAQLNLSNQLQLGQLTERAHK